jgi:hypothetical protein
MIEVPVGRNAIVGAVLAHRRDHDSVGELEVSEPDWGKQSTGHIARVDLENQNETRRA